MMKRVDSSESFYQRFGEGIGEVRSQISNAGFPGDDSFDSSNVPLGAVQAQVIERNNGPAAEPPLTRALSASRTSSFLDVKQKPTFFQRLKATVKKNWDDVAVRVSGLAVGTGVAVKMAYSAMDVAHVTLSSLSNMVMGPLAGIHAIAESIQIYRRYRAMQKEGQVDPPITNAEIIARVIAEGIIPSIAGGASAAAVVGTSVASAVVSAGVTTPLIAVAVVESALIYTAVHKAAQWIMKIAMDRIFGTREKSLLDSIIDLAPGKKDEEETNSQNVSFEGDLPSQADLRAVEKVRGMSLKVTEEHDYAAVHHAEVSEDQTRVDGEQDKYIELTQEFHAPSTRPERKAAIKAEITKLSNRFLPDDEENRKPIVELSELLVGIEKYTAYLNELKPDDSSQYDATISRLQRKRQLMEFNLEQLARSSLPDKEAHRAKFEALKSMIDAKIAEFTRAKEIHEQQVAAERQRQLQEVEAAEQLEAAAQLRAQKLAEAKTAVQKHGATTLARLKSLGVDPWPPELTEDTWNGFVAEQVKAFDAEGVDINATGQAAYQAINDKFGEWGAQLFAIQKVGLSDAEALRRGFNTQEEQRQLSILKGIEKSERDVAQTDIQAREQRKNIQDAIRLIMERAAHTWKILDKNNRTKKGKIINADLENQWNSFVAEQLKPFENPDVVTKEAGQKAFTTIDAKAQQITFELASESLLSWDDDEDEPETLTKAHQDGKTAAVGKQEMRERVTVVADEQTARTGLNLSAEQGVVSSSEQAERRTVVTTEGKARARLGVEGEEGVGRAETKQAEGTERGKIEVERVFQGEDVERTGVAREEAGARSGLTTAFQSGAHIAGVKDSEQQGRSQVSSEEQSARESLTGKESVEHQQAVQKTQERVSKEEAKARQLQKQAIEQLSMINSEASARKLIADAEASTRDGLAKAAQASLGAAQKAQELREAKTTARQVIDASLAAVLNKLQGQNCPAGEPYLPDLEQQWSVFGKTITDQVEAAQTPEDANAMRTNSHNSIVRKSGELFKTIKAAELKRAQEAALAKIQAVSELALTVLRAANQAPEGEEPYVKSLEADWGEHIAAQNLQVKTQKTAQEVKTQEPIALQSIQTKQVELLGRIEAEKENRAQQDEGEEEDDADAEDVESVSGESEFKFADIPDQLKPYIEAGVKLPLEFVKMAQEHFNRFCNIQNPSENDTLLGAALGYLLLKTLPSDPAIQPKAVTLLKRYLSTPKKTLGKTARRIRFSTNRKTPANWERGAPHSRVKSMVLPRAMHALQSSLDPQETHEGLRGLFINIPVKHPTQNRTVAQQLREDKGYLERISRAPQKEISIGTLPARSQTTKLQVSTHGAAKSLQANLEADWAKANMPMPLKTLTQMIRDGHLDSNYLNRFPDAGVSVLRDYVYPYLVCEHRLAKPASLSTTFFDDPATAEDLLSVLPYGGEDDTQRALALFKAMRVMSRPMSDNGLGGSPISKSQIQIFKSLTASREGRLRAFHLEAGAGKSKAIGIYHEVFAPDAKIIHVSPFPIDEETGAIHMTIAEYRRRCGLEKDPPEFNAKAFGEEPIFVFDEYDSPAYLDTQELLAKKGVSYFEMSATRPLDDVQTKIDRNQTKLNFISLRTKDSLSAQDKAQMKAVADKVNRREPIANEELINTYKGEALVKWLQKNPSGTLDGFLEHLRVKRQAKIDELETSKQQILQKMEAQFARQMQMASGKQEQVLAKAVRLGASTKGSILIEMPESRNPTQLKDALKAALGPKAASSAIIYRDEQGTVHHLIGDRELTPEAFDDEMSKNPIATYCLYTSDCRGGDFREHSKARVAEQVLFYETEIPTSNEFYQNLKRDRTESPGASVHVFTGTTAGSFSDKEAFVAKTKEKQVEFDRTRRATRNLHRAREAVMRDLKSSLLGQVKSPEQRSLIEQGLRGFVVDPEKSVEVLKTEALEHIRKSLGNVELIQTVKQYASDKQSSVAGHTHFSNLSKALEEYMRQEPLAVERTNYPNRVRDIEAFNTYLDSLQELLVRKFVDANRVRAMQKAFSELGVPIDEALAKMTGIQLSELESGRVSSSLNNAIKKFLLAYNSWEPKSKTTDFQETFAGTVQGVGAITPKHLTEIGKKLTGHKAELETAKQTLKIILSKVGKSIAALKDTGSLLPNGRVVRGVVEKWSLEGCVNSKKLEIHESFLRSLANPMRELALSRRTQDFIDAVRSDRLQAAAAASPRGTGTPGKR